MAERFLKFIPSEEAFWLLENKPNAFRLLTHIANTARRTDGSPDGLKIGQCHLQHWSKYKLTERQYRTAKKILKERGHIDIIDTNRTRQKSTTGTTTKSTLVELCSTTVYDINSESRDDRKDDRETTERRQTRMNKKEKEYHHPHTPSLDLSEKPTLMIDDFSSESKKREILPGIFLTEEEIESCIKLKGSLEKVIEAMKHILESDRRKATITDWPHALASWNIPKAPRQSIEKRLALAERLCAQYDDYQNGWRFRRYRDEKKEQEGLLFESQSAYEDAVFIAFADAAFEAKCRKLIEEKVVAVF